MTEQEIRKDLKEYHKTKAVNNIHWIARELEFQLDRNYKLDEQLTGLLKAGKPFRRLADFAVGLIDCPGIQGLLAQFQDNKYPDIITVEHLCRLAQAMDKIEEAK